MAKTPPTLPARRKRPSRRRPAPKQRTQAPVSHTAKALSVAPKASTPAPVRDDALVRQSEVIISFILRAGVVVSGIIIAVGSLLYFIEAAQQAHGSRAAPHELTTIGGILHDLLAGDPLAIIMVGLVLLLLTPVLRVIVSIGAFALERDWRYVAITSLVLIILIISFLLGKGGA